MSTPILFISFNNVNRRNSFYKKKNPYCTQKEAETLLETIKFKGWDVNFTHPVII